MSVFEVSRSASASQGLMAQVYANTIGAYVAWKEARDTRAALDKLSDRELDDIGISRGDIDAIARRF
jgi:uncharacterized protein YjiS (DUF1127 family)